MNMNYGWPNTPQGIKLFHIAHQKNTIFKTNFRTVSGQNLGRDTTIYSDSEYILINLYNANTEKEQINVFSNMFDKNILIYLSTQN